MNGLFREQFISRIGFKNERVKYLTHKNYTSSRKDDTSVSSIF